MNVYDVTKAFEDELCKYTGAPYAIAVDNCSNALFLSLKYELSGGEVLDVPSRTYPSVPCAVIHAGGKVNFTPVEGKLKGAYQLTPSKVWDSALRFTANMYVPGSHMCLSFTGPYKHLKLSKGGAILTDDEDACKWFRKARYSGRNEKPYMEDEFDMLGWNFYMMPELAARGLLLISQFKGENPDLEMQFPDLSRFPVYR